MLHYSHRSDPRTPAAPRAPAPAVAEVVEPADQFPPPRGVYLEPEKVYGCHVYAVWDHLGVFCGFRAVRPGEDIVEAGRLARQWLDENHPLPARALELVA